MARRALPWVTLLAATLHLLGLCRSFLPAQDGLKFIRVAREFQTKPWADVIRGTDRHPLYPAAVALTQPVIVKLTGPGPHCWRIAAQVVSMLASIALLVPLYGFTRSLYDERTALVASLLFVLLPLPAEVGHDTLSDGLALFAAMLAFRFGEVALRGRRIDAALGCGIAAGLGFLTRPEVLVVPLAVVVTLLVQMRTEQRLPLPAWRLGAVTVAVLTIVGTYALMKGEVSEKLSLRLGAAMPGHQAPVRKPPRWLPPGLDDPRWDFSAKEETGAPPRSPVHRALARVVSAWSEDLGWVLAPLAIWGFVRVRGPDAGRPGRLLASIYLLLFGGILVRHAMTLGYLSGRHALSMVLVSLPWAAAGILDVACRVGRRLGEDSPRAMRWGVTALVLAIGVGVTVQLKTAHATRWGHWAAGRWLAENTRTTDAVLDTRGWAAFVSGRPSYDYWHVRQAFTDAKLAYVVVGQDELTAPSRRAATLRAVLAYAATPVASFPETQGGSGTGVEIFRFQAPASWEGMRP